MHGKRAIRNTLAGLAGLWLAAAIGSASIDALREGGKTGWDHFRAPLTVAWLSWEAVTAEDPGSAGTKPLRHDGARSLAPPARRDFAPMSVQGLGAPQHVYDVAGGASPAGAAAPGALGSSGAVFAEPEWLMRLILSLTWGEASP